jgi:hypothetical protein
MDVIRTLKSRFLRPRLSNDVLARGDGIGSDRSGRSSDKKCSNTERMKLHVMVSEHSLRMFLPHFIVIAGNNKGVKGTMKVSGTVSRCNWRIRFLTPLFPNGFDVLPGCLSVCGQVHRITGACGHPRLPWRQKRQTCNVSGSALLTENADSFDFSIRELASKLGIERRAFH